MNSFMQPVIFLLMVTFVSCSDEHFSSSQLISREQNGQQKADSHDSEDYMVFEVEGFDEPIRVLIPPGSAGVSIQAGNNLFDTISGEIEALLSSESLGDFAAIPVTRALVVKTKATGNFIIEIPIENQDSDLIVLEQKEGHTLLLGELSLNRQVVIDPAMKIAKFPVQASGTYQLMQLVQTKKNDQIAKKDKKAEDSTNVFPSQENLPPASDPELESEIEEESEPEFASESEQPLDLVPPMDPVESAQSNMPPSSENQSPSVESILPPSFTVSTLTNDAMSANFVEVADIDNDGDDDILFAARGASGRITFYRNDGLGNFTELNLAQLQTWTLQAVDIVPGGSKEILYGTNTQLGYFEEQNGVFLQVPFPFSFQNTIVRALAFDANNDGKIDVAICHGGSISLFPAILDSLSPIVISATFGCRDMKITDFDSDGDDDLAIADDNTNRVYLLKNLGNLSFDLVEIANNIANAKHISPIDFDGDGDVDFLSAARSGDAVFLHRQQAGNFTTESLVDGNNLAHTDGMHSVEAVDLDNDGDLDLLTTLYEGDAVFWYENSGNQVFANFHKIQDIEGGIMAKVIDANADNRKDIVAVSYDDASLRLLLNVPAALQP